MSAVRPGLTARFAITTSCLLAFGGPPIVAQEGVGSGAYLGLGLGLGTLGTAPAGTLEATYWRDTHRVSVFSGGVGGTSAGSVRDLGVLYGRTRTSGRIRTAVAGGVALVDPQVTCTVEDSADECIDDVTIGLPVTAEASVLFQLLSVGVKVFGDLNRSKSFAGMALTVSLGRLR